LSRSPSRRELLRNAGIITAAAGLPLATTGTARAAEPSGVPFVDRADAPGAKIPHVSDADHALGVSREPLNASVECGRRRL
jgi:hypothetical protein